jgi:RHS repeat-associated protein
MSVSVVSARLLRVRWLIVVLVLALLAAVPALSPVARAEAVVPGVTEGARPVDRPAPRSARPDEALPAEKLPPAVPEGVAAAGDPVRLSARDWERVAEPGEAVAAAETVVFENLELRSGFSLADTSLVAYFDVRDEPGWSSWRVRAFDKETGTEQASSVLPRSELVDRCSAVRMFCRSFGRAEGWVLDPAKKYFISIAAEFDDGTEVESRPSPEANPRTTIEPPPIPAGQAKGCGCGAALALTAARQALRGDGVNTGTGAFTRVEPDLSMASFGVPFSSTRVYSSANGEAGVFGPGWAWSYGMRVTESAQGAVVRADDGAEALYRLVDGAYQRPAGVRSNLRRAGDGWELVRVDQVVYRFDGQGRLVSVLSPRGVGVTLAYTSSGIAITDASGRVVQVRITGGLVRDILLPDQRKVQYEYDTAGRLVVYKDARARQWRYGYNAAGLISEIQDPQPLRVVLARNEYDASGRMLRQIDAMGNVTRFAWDAEHQEATTTDADGVIVRDGYRGNVLVYSRRGNGDTDNHRYDASLNRNLVVDGNHNQHESAFDANGNPTVQNAPTQMGFGQRVRYDERNNPIEFVDENGNTWRNTFNEFNELVESRDAEDHTIRYSYDDRGLLQTRTDQRGKITRFEYLPAGGPNAGLLLAVISPEGRRSEVRYDATGRRIASIDPRGTVPGADPGAFTTSYTLDEQDRVLTVSEPGKEHPWRTSYDEVGRMVSTVNPTSLEVRYSYLDNGRLESVTDPRKTTAITYTAAGRRASVRVRMGDQGPDIVTTYRYNVKGLLHETTSPRGNVPGANAAEFTTTYRYDANDNLVRISRPYPNGEVVHQDIKVDGLDRTTSTVDAFNKPSTFARANTGEVTSATDTLGQTVAMGYDRNGRQTSMTDAGNNTSRFTYDEAGNKIREQNATGGVTTWTYSDDGLLSSTTEPRGNVEGADAERFTTHFDYDRAGNQTKVTDALDHTTVRTYDATSRTTSITDARGNTTHYRYREDNQIETVHAPDAVFHPEAPHNNATLYGYYEDGLLATVRDPNLHVTRLDYDRAGRPTSTTDPLNRRTELTYDTENNVLTAFTRMENESPSDAERARRTIVDTYDIVGRRTNRALGTDGPRYAWGYDAKDRTTSYADPLGRRQVTYDDEDQITEVTRQEANDRTETFGYKYDARGNITQRTYPDGTTIDAGYDADSRMTELKASEGSTGAQPATWTFGYDIAGQRTTTTLPTGTGLIEQRDYDQAGRLVGIGTTRPPGAGPPEGVDDPVSNFDLDLDEVGNPTKVTTTRGGVSEAVAYTYDPADRVTSACYAATSCAPDAPNAGRIDYTYDLVGNRTRQVRTGSAGSDTTDYSYDVANQLTRQTVTNGGASMVTDYTYDLQGNQTKAGNDTFRYNLDHSLASATVEGRTTDYAYDASGLRLTATTDSGEEAKTQRWTWDVNGTLPQIAIDTVTDAAGTTVERRGFAYGTDDEPLALLDPGTGAHPYTHDWLGGIANMLTPAGQIEAGYDYDPYGNPRRGDTLPDEETPGLKNPLQYTGAYQDGSSGEGNYYLRARNYNPGTGRFTATDPMPQGGAAVSTYAYADNNPLAFTDPAGTMPAPDGGGGVPPATGAPLETGGTEQNGPSPEDLAKAQQIQSKSLLDVVIEAGGQILMEILGINDIINCLKGDIGACVMAVIGSLPWGKIFKAKKIAQALFKAGKAVLTFFEELKWAKAIIRGAERAAEAAKAAAAAAAKAAAEKAAKAKAAAETAARKAAAEAAARAKALAAKAKAATKKSADNGAASCKRKHSFPAGTLVLLADGTSKPLELVRPGSTVIATDPETGRTERRQVTHLIRSDHDKHYIDIAISGSDDRQHTVVTTGNHPFWSATQERWVRADELEQGELLRTAAGTYVQIDSIRHSSANRITYDLSVDGIHAYYVLADTLPILVHNLGSATSPCDDIPWSSRSVKRAAKQLEEGATSVTVRNRAEAEELFLRRYQGDGYVNTTDMKPQDAKDFLRTVHDRFSKEGSYHWDEYGGTGPHDFMPHLQIHAFTGGDIIRIHFPA